ncbi:MAG TPA: UvrD-helicase domain-containing protein [Polyangiales bacterium]|nr:UvrD-helicase domain-containing protein [Polyangiales bacterium]
MNPEQQAAVVHGDGPLVVFAGAGSGKTRVITQRVAHLIEQRLVPPWRVLAVTFTNKAAREMRERLEHLIPGQASSLWVGTFHAVCARLLRAHAQAIGLRRDFVIYDDGDQRSMIARVMRDLSLDERTYPPKQLAYHINTAKQESKTPDQLEVNDAVGEIAREVYAAYEQRMAAASALDFGDLIYRLVQAMRTDPELRTQVQNRFDYVLVDEFQDVNHVQFEFVQLLCEKHHNLCVVGDDDQSIYRWRGADRRNILDFRHHFPEAHIVKLEQNYRSTQRILRVANAVVGRNLDREPKALWTQNEPGSAVTVLPCADERDEANLVMHAVRMLLEAGLERNDIAILYRTHAQSRAFEEALRRSNTPYRVIGGLRFYDRAEVKDLLAYLRIIGNPADDVSLLRVINTPARGIGKTTIERLMDAASRAGSSVHDALLAADQDSAHSSATKKKLEAFVQLLGSLRAFADTENSPAELSRHVLEVTSYAKMLREEDTPEADSRLENIGEVLSSMEQYVADAEKPSLSDFLETVTLETDADRRDVENAITLMTVHAAKGLEFPAVFVAGLEEETFPRHRPGAHDEHEELEEERRLAYVAFTRARQRLFLSYANTRRMYGEVKLRRRSRFIDEAPAEELHVVGVRRSQPSSGGYNNRPSSPPPTQQRPEGRYIDRSEANDVQELYRGMRVRHTKFGVGEVTAISAGEPPRVTVQFPDGPRQIVSTFLTPA